MLKTGHVDTFSQTIYLLATRGSMCTECRLDFYVYLRERPARVTRIVPPLITSTHERNSTTTSGAVIALPHLTSEARTSHKSTNQLAFPPIQGYTRVNLNLSRCTP